MRASRGAIEKVEIDPQSGLAACEVIGAVRPEGTDARERTAAQEAREAVRPEGICGSGMIALFAELFQSGWLDASGRLDTSRPCPAIVPEGRRHAYILVPAEGSATGSPIKVTEFEIENLLRTKAAIYSACSLMLKQVGLAFNDLAHVYLAGGFGRYLDIGQALVLGLIPDLPREKFVYVGNASLTGSVMVLLSREFREKQQALARKMTYLELNTDPAYMDEYTGALFIPHTEAARFPTVPLPARR